MMTLNLGSLGHKQPCFKIMLFLISLLIALSLPSVATQSPATHVITIDGMQFIPSSLQVNAGDTVIWKNKDPYPHNVTADNNGFRSTTIPSDQSWTYTANKKGEFTYICTLHTTMKGQLIVK